MLLAKIKEAAEMRYAGPAQRQKCFFAVNPEPKSFRHQSHRFSEHVEIAILCAEGATRR